MTYVHLLNVDLELRSKQPLDALLDAFGDSVIAQRPFLTGDVYYTGMGLADACPVIPESVETMLVRCCDMIEGLDAEARAMWDACETRTLDAGFASGDTLPVLGASVTPQTLGRLAALNATFALTIYPIHPDPERGGPYTPDPKDARV